VHGCREIGGGHRSTQARLIDLAGLPFVKFQPDELMSEQAIKTETDQASAVPVQPVKKIWLKQRGEWARAYEAFKAYLNMGANRNVRATAPVVKVSDRSVLGYSTRFQWVLRAEAYDAFMAEEAQKERERLQREREAEWEQRRETQRQEEWLVGQALIQKGKLMLAAPLYEEIEETQTGDECTTIVKKPTGWRLRDAVRVLDEGSKLSRLGAGMATDKKEIDIDVTSLSDDELEKIIKS
jgi:hypothetical protein